MSFPRRESCSLPASLSSTPTQPSFLAEAAATAASMASNWSSHPDSASVNDEHMTGLPPLSPSPGLQPDFALRDPFAVDGNQSYTPTSNSNPGQYSLGRRMSEDPEDLLNQSSFKNPKLERTISDVLEDELYTPNMSPVQSTTSDDLVFDFPDPVTTLSNNAWAAKSLPATRTASPSPSSSSSLREMSPFRKSSPFYPGPPADSPLMHSQSHYDLFPKLSSVKPTTSRADLLAPRPQSSTSHYNHHGKPLQQQVQQLQFHKQQKLASQSTSHSQQSQPQRQLLPSSMPRQHFAGQTSQPIQQQYQSTTGGKMFIDTTPSKTISPQEALIDFDESQTEQQPELQRSMFAPTPSVSSSTSSLNNIKPDLADSIDNKLTDFDLFSSNPATPFPRSQADRFDATSQSSIMSSPIPSENDDDMAGTAMSSVSPSIRSIQSNNPSDIASSSEDIGTFTCSECGKRFPKDHNLQLHLRTHVTSPSRKKIPLAAQTGHRCTWINPSTGKPCNKVFSRPYDLIRHQETIHAANRKMFKCELCGDDTKTFSRQDALARHIRVKHDKTK
ncbi:hypothetical protein V1514DRAFT_340471 [Lipomyces japonicus]|uniref:uncharacterized protein n=1 Tax=Lipomyces japonicus TaxID=56871 RepID=UPI0034CDC4C0